MYIEIDLTTVPPEVCLREPDRFDELHVEVRRTDHVRVRPEHLLELAGDRAQEPRWREGFEAMIAYAARRGWVDEQGVRAHVESLDDAPLA